MGAISPFSWQAENGWLVLSGGVDALGDIRGRALSRSEASGDIVYISLADDLGDSLMDDMAELGATSGYLLDIEEADNNEVYERLSGAVMIVIEANGRGPDLLRLLRRTAVHPLKDALNRGGLVLLEGAAAATAGEYSLDSAGQIVAGLGLLQGALVVADSFGFDDKHLRSIQLQWPKVTFLSLAAGTALVLGPDGAIETWGDRQVSISLGDLAGAFAESERDWAVE